MAKLNKPLFIAILLAFSFSIEGCDLFNKDEPKTELEKLPPATQSGENTFGCLVNGKAWVTETSIDADAYYQEGVLFIFAGLINSNFYQGISVTLTDNNLSEQEYILIDDPHGNLEDLKNHCDYSTSIINSGKLIITHLDQINFIISGTFEFEAYSDVCDDVVKVTKGRFDLHYAP